MDDALDEPADIDRTSCGRPFRIHLWLLWVADVSRVVLPNDRLVASRARMELFQKLVVKYVYKADT